MSETPSWAARPTPAPSPSKAAGRPPKTLLVALILTAAMVSVEVTHVARRDELVVGLRVFLILIIASQLVMAAGAVRRSATAAFGLLVCQVTTIVAALAGGFGVLRPALAVGAAAVIVLVAASLNSFPTVAIPSLDRGRDDA